MKKFFININILFFLTAFSLSLLLAGVPTQEIQNQKKELQIFSDIERTFSSGNISLISSYFPSQIYLSLSTGVNGFYSGNQAYYILQNYFQVYQPIAFKYTQRSESDNGFATGVFSFENRNKKGTAQVFISIEYSGARWKISLITIK
ncbi:MAG: DUF4783 domain-containing protein [Ignavibacteria bacterium]|nr:DUF4783 domain-containing protein [Ignavibacteria bacterium]NCS81318.1 DUF4783 domain-containing protein [Ignavibacteria bacterium]OIO19985.1 MAG: hypothetical protein AUJ54_06025 [Ignavibacteria bacterium CG1_02_37_35]PIX94012.1 MAG: hypothetical protein COZ25_07700 [Ignavibacteria bacterium CG_4_10_14_3_um_filter_37_18]PJC58057.1 MAG: hypothetical protein CO025_10265 [Ignavibacteria bacterium CG_4_9_14_0_2_um_filter_37_13]